MIQEIVANALRYHCPTCGAGPDQSCCTWQWNKHISKSGFIADQMVHPARAKIAVRNVTKRLQGLTQI